MRVVKVIAKEIKQEILAKIKSLCAEVRGVYRKNICHESVLEAKDELVKQVILDTWKEHPSYGHKRLGLHLKINHKRVKRVMKKFELAEQLDNAPK